MSEWASDDVKIEMWKRLLGRIFLTYDGKGKKYETEDRKGGLKIAMYDFTEKWVCSYFGMCGI